MSTEDADHPRTADNGFTLAELLVVVTIIGILAAISIPTFLVQRDKTDVTVINAALKNAATAAESITVDNPTATNWGRSQATFAANGYIATEGLSVMINGSPATGYCILAYDTESAFYSDEDVLFYGYDSLAGGLLPPPKETYFYPSTPACDRPGSFAVVG